MKIKQLQTYLIWLPITKLQYYFVLYTSFANILMQKMQEHGFLRSRFIPVFVLKSLAKENGV